LIESGKAVALKTIDGEEKEVLRYAENDYFGERALLTNDRRAATV
jgi:CRP-like cAMP-binding protein